MQNKDVGFLILFLAGIHGLGMASDSRQILQSADSLFDEKKYTESFELYSKLLDSRSEVSPRMLMKMAFIKEGLGDYSSALYYLNLYYLKTSDPDARQKMKDIADEHRLSGFVIDDAVFFKRLLNKFRTPITLLLCSLTLLAAGVLMYSKIKQERTARPQAIILCFLLIALFLFVNLSTAPDEAIVIKDHTYLMSGPSSGADLVDIIGKGHRVSIKGEAGPWLEIQWNDKKAFIKNNRVKRFG